MKQKIHYPEEFTGTRDIKYKLITVYDHFALYESEKGYKSCFNIDTIRRETAFTKNYMGG